MTGHNGNGRGDVDVDRRRREFQHVITMRVTSAVRALEGVFPGGWGFSIVVAPYDTVTDPPLLAYGGTLHHDRTIQVLRTMADALECAGPPPPPSKPTKSP